MAYRLTDTLCSSQLIVMSENVCYCPLLSPPGLFVTKRSPRLTTTVDIQAYQKADKKSHQARCAAAAGTFESKYRGW